MTWSVDAAAWVWWCNDLGSRCSGVGLIVGCCVFFFGSVDGLGFFFLVLMADFGLVVVVVSGVCSSAVVVIVVLEQKKERERINNVWYCK